MGRRERRCRRAASVSEWEKRDFVFTEVRIIFLGLRAQFSGTSEHEESSGDHFNISLMQVNIHVKN